MWLFPGVVVEEEPQNLVATDTKWNGIMKEDMADTAAYQVLL